jgi:hypothetical protein
VRIAGHFHDEGYLITITDRGVGVPSRRLTELNELLARPPVVGLALEPTLGLYVVAMLAKRHGVRVRLVTGAPGLTAHVMIPKELFEISVDEPMRPLAGSPSQSEPQVEPTPMRASESVVRPPAARPVHETVEVRSARHTSPGQQPSGLPQRPSQAPSEPSSVPAPVASDDTELSPAGLPTRKPGASFTAPEVTERAVEISSRDPEEIKSAFSSFQLGMSVGRDSNREEVHHE